MTHSYRIVSRLATACAAICLSVVPVQAQDTTSSAILRLKFRDSDTGFGLVPKAVIIDGIVLNPGGRGARDEMVVPLEEGDHQVTVKADGFNDLTSKQAAFPEDEAPLNVIALDPSEPAFEFRQDTLMSYVKPGGSLIAGCVVDDVTGDPVKDAIVAVAGITTKTSERGFFTIPIALPDAQRPTEDDGSGTRFARRGFSVYKPGYGPVERRNVLLMVGIPKTFRLRLIEGNTPDVEDEEDNRGNLPASTFGLPGSGPAHKQN